MLEYDVTAKRVDAHGSTARCKDAEIVLDTDVSGRLDAFNPAELFLAAIAACTARALRPKISAKALPETTDLFGVARQVTPEALEDMLKWFGFAE